MLVVPKEEMFLNRFTDTRLPSKMEIFSRTGQRAVNPAGKYTGDDAYKSRYTKTESCEVVATAAESYEPSVPPVDGSE